MTAPGQAYGAGRQCSHGWGKCDRTDTRAYAAGPLCPDHTPARLAGRPEPDAARYCLAICYCGQCPGYRGRLLTPTIDTVVDLEAKRTGKRRSRSLAEYRDAQHARQEHTA